MRKRITFLILLSLLPMMLFGGTAGKLKGRVTDSKTGEAVIGANVVVLGTSLGAQADVNGDFVVYNVVAGVYSVRCSYVGYQTVTIQNVRVNADLTTEMNFQLAAEGVSVKEIEVVATRPLVNKNATNANRITTAEDIEALPARGVDNILSLTAGVTLQDKTIFIRGGRQDEVGYYLEGASITDPVVGGRGVTIVQDAIEEIQVQAGGYNAEYGGANAGIIYSQIKSGTPEWKAAVQYITDNVTLKGSKDRYDGKKRLGSFWYGYSEFTGTVSGPLFDKNIKFFGLVNYSYQADQNPQPYPGINLGKVGDAKTGDTINFNYPGGSLFTNSLAQLNFTGSVSVDLNPVMLRFVGTYTKEKTFNPFSSSRISGNVANMFNQDRVENVDSRDGSFSLKATHILTPKTFYEVSAGYAFNGLDRYDPVLKDNFFSYGDSLANANAGVKWTRRPNNSNRFSRPRQYEVYGFVFNSPGDVVSGYQKFKRERLNFAGSLSTQLGKEHSVKVGGEYQSFVIRNYSWGNEAAFALAGLIDQNDKLAANDPLKKTKDQIIIGRGINNYGYDLYGNESDADQFAKAKKPVLAAFYIQDKIEYKDLVINAGLRYDYISIDNQEFVDPTRPDKTFNKNTGEILPSGLKDVPAFNAVSPRLGFSFSVTEKTIFHAQFGKFVQQSRFRDAYQGLYATSYNLRGGFEITAPVGFNIRPTRTTQYEIGFTQQIGDVASFDLTGYYKDILDQIVFDKQKVVAGYGFADYNILKNGDFATTKGLEISFNVRRIERVQASATLTFNDAQGTGSFPNSARGIVGAPLDGVTVFKPQYISPLEYNNAIRGNINLDYRWAKGDGPTALQDLGISALMSFNSGHPFTRGKGGADLEGDARDRQPIEALNTSTTPWVFQVDLRIDKSFTIMNMLKANVYLYVVNLFDTKNIQNVFLRTGSTDDDGYLSDPALGGKLIATNGPVYEKLYKAINIDYYEQWQQATTGAPYTTTPYFFGAPRQVRFGIRLEY